MSTPNDLPIENQNIDISENILAEAEEIQEIAKNRTDVLLKKETSVVYSLVYTFSGLVESIKGNTRIAQLGDELTETKKSHIERMKMESSNDENYQQAA